MTEGRFGRLTLTLVSGFELLVIASHTSNVKCDQIESCDEKPWKGQNQNTYQSGVRMDRMIIKCLEKSPSIKELVEIKRISRIFGGTYIDMHEICHLPRTLRTNKIHQSMKK